MHLTRQLTLLYGIISGLLAAIGILLLFVGTGHANLSRQSPAPTAGPAPGHITSPELAIVVIVASLVLVVGLIAAGFYWRAQSLDAHIAQENARLRRDEVEKTLQRLRERMSLPSLVELNRLMLTEYHSIATNQAQKSFKSSQRAMLGGFSWLLACFTAVIFVGPLNGKIIAATMAPVGTVLAGYLGRTYLVAYDRALVQLSQYYSQPLQDSYYLAAERLTCDMSHEAKDRLLGSVVEQLLAVARNFSDGSARIYPAPRRSRITVPGMRQGPAGADDLPGPAVIITPARGSPQAG